MPVDIHRHRQRTVTGEALYRFWLEPCLDPATHREVSQAVPVKARHACGLDERLEPTTQEADMLGETATLRKN
jgi:hypothetical protein